MSSSVLADVRYALRQIRLAPCVPAAAGSGSVALCWRSKPCSGPAGRFYSVNQSFTG